ncbi:Protein conserved in the green lineage and diatoms 27, chloroplastic [Heracleum sosnowskyi]|uniref:Protein conserved in the green lineage and diatoms 27, chloroplastic n=1 Tax=Heracleum sosnowskyi TaxID=360622 RepID=A0AAD8MEA7_9APIA|nr:Protein conserved in the green lineage and diatoms 27, chloroplastic [Heracleum sosnowskyi]
MATASILSLKPTLLPPSFSSLSNLNFPCFLNPKLQNQHRKNILKLPFYSSYENSNYNSPETECPVPLDQQPVNEYQSLSSSQPYSWASGDFSEYCSRLFVTGVSFALFVGLPVSWYGSVGVGLDPVKRVLGAVCGGFFVATFVVVRMYLGWAYVGNRLLSATVEYEETGWYDGQTWVKTPEVLARDRLLGSFSVKPVLSRLKNTLVGLGLSLFMCIILFINTEGSRPKDTYISSEQTGGRAVRGVYSEESAKSFEPEAFCGDAGISPTPTK